jgi:uncharacterized protein (DUF1810 family)
MTPSTDPHNLQRFLTAQEPIYVRVLRELRAGRKESHWMWFIFPQLAGLGNSAMAQRYAIQSLDEARSYLGHPILGARLRECAELVLAVNGRTIHEILGLPDDLKLCSCATLFAAVSAEGSVFEWILAKYYDGAEDERTLELLASNLEK